MCDEIKRNTQLFIPKVFDDCYTYEKQLLWLYNKVTELEARVEELENKNVEV